MSQAWAPRTPVPAPTAHGLEPEPRVRAAEKDGDLGSAAGTGGKAKRRHPGSDVGRGGVLGAPVFQKGN